MSRSFAIKIWRASMPMKMAGEERYGDEEWGDKASVEVLGLCASVHVLGDCIDLLGLVSGFQR